VCWTTGAPQPPFHPAPQRILSPGASLKGRHLYVIESPTFTGTWVYTKGTFRRKGGREVFYVFVSAKLAV